MTTPADPESVRQPGPASPQPPAEAPGVPHERHMSQPSVPQPSVPEPSAPQPAAPGAQTSTGGLFASPGRPVPPPPATPSARPQGAPGASVDASAQARPVDGAPTAVIPGLPVTSAHGELGADRSSQYGDTDPRAVAGAEPVVLSYDGRFPEPAPVAERRRRSMSVAWVVPMLVLALLAGAGGGAIADRLFGAPRPTSVDLPVAHPTDGPASVEREASSVAAIAAKVLPSTVLINVQSGDGRGSGSGFVLQQDGYILTNNHVVSGGGAAGASIEVTFADGTSDAATLVGATADYDLAVIKVERTGLVPLVLGDSEAVLVGDPVVAVGAPLGLQGTVTSGIVSAKNRPVTAGQVEDYAFINAIQTDAAINPGNSGGPLVNAAGEVIGINSAIAQPPGAALSGTAGSIGLGFAIPSNQARTTAEQLITKGKATYPVIGVMLDLRYEGDGVRVVSEGADGQQPVTPDGPADAAGIRPGDVILAIDGRPVTDPDELIVAIRARTPGDSVRLTVRTDEEEREVTLVLVASPD